MGPLHCPLCIGLALLALIRTACYGVLLAQMTGFGSKAEAAAATQPLTTAGALRQGPASVAV